MGALWAVQRVALEFEPVRSQLRKLIVVTLPRLEDHRAKHDQRDDLRAGHSLTGPLIVEEREATILVENGWQLNVDTWGNLILKYTR